MEELSVGEYKLPQDCTALKTSRDGESVIIVYQKKNLNIPVTETRCRNCKHFGEDYSDFNSGWRTTVCMQKPKTTNNMRYRRQATHYHVGPLHKICELFEER